MSREAIAAVLDGSMLDTDTRDYVIELLVGDDDDDDELEDVLSGFLTEEADASILQRLLAIKRGACSAEAPAVPDTEPLRRLEQAVTISDAAADISDAVPPPPATQELLTPLAPKEKEKKGVGAGGAAARERVFGTDDYGSAQHGALNELDDLDDHSYKWEALKASGGKGVWSGTQKKYVQGWGGRGMGGRGVPKLYSENNPNVHLDNVTLHYKGKELLGEWRDGLPSGQGLVGSTLQLQRGHCYGLIGRNGVGKSTLLKRIARGSLPGFPLHLRCHYLQQEGLAGACSVWDSLLAADDRLASLRAEAERWEGLGSEEVSESGGAAEQASYLAELYERLEALEAEASERHTEALAVLTELGFTRPMRERSVSALSGGWRMRLALARALFARPDVLLLDEPTNHLDVRGVLWLSRQLQRRWAVMTVLLVSHDAAFLDDACTDIIVFADKALTYHAGSYSSYLEGAAQEASRHATRSAAVERQVERQKHFIAKQRAAATAKRGASVDDNKLRQAKEREKKLERIGLGRADGHRYKTMSMARFGVTSLPERAQQIRRDPNLRFHLPEPSPPLRGSADLAVISLSEVSFSYGRQREAQQVPGPPSALPSASPSPSPSASPSASASASAPAPASASASPSISPAEPPAALPAALAEGGSALLSSLTLQVNAGSRIGVLGENGVGKTTLVRLLDGSLSASRGEVHRAHGLRVATVSQHQLERLQPHLDGSSLAFLMAELTAQGETPPPKPQEVLNHLGSFGLAGDLAKQPIGVLSGGQKARLNMASVMWCKPHVLILDEPTNHLDSDALEALQLGIGGFGGAIVAISHSMPFLGAFCSELWVVRQRAVAIHHLDTPAALESVYDAYCESITAEWSS